MRIKRFETNGFGCLKGSYQFGSLPSTLIIEKNEMGKSTFVAGILAALYGLEENGSQELRERERFKPMNGEKFDVTLSIQIGERDYRIVRDFKTDSVAIWDENTGEEITSEFDGGNGCVTIAEALTAMSRDGFLKTSLIRQNEVRVLGETPDIPAKIEAMIDTLSGDATVRRAISLLREARHRGPDNSALERKIEQLRQKLRSYEAEWEALQQARRLVDERGAQLLEITQRYEHLKEALDRARYAALVSQKEVLEGRVSQYEKSKKGLEDLRSELKSLGNFSSFPHDRADDLAEAIKSVIDTDRQITTLKDEIEAIRGEVGQLDKRVMQEFKTIQALTEDDFAEISELVKALMGSVSTLSELRSTYGADKKLIIHEGYPLKDYPHLKKMLGKITAEERSQAAQYQEGSRIKKNEIRSLKREIHLREQQAEKNEAELKRKRKSRNRAILVGCALILLSVVIHPLKTSVYQGVLTELAIDWIMVQAASGVVGVIVILWGMIGGLRGRKRMMQAWLRHLQRIDNLRAKKDEIERRQGAEKAKIDQLASRTGFRSGDQLCERLKQFDRLEERTGKLRATAAQLKEIKSDVVRNRSKLIAHMKRFGEKPEKALGAGMARFYRKMKAYRKVQSDRKLVHERQARLEKRILEVDGERKGKEERLASVLRECQISWESDGNKAIEAYKKRLRCFHRHVTIRDELIPKAQLDEIPEEEYRDIVSALADVQGAMTEIEKRCADGKCSAPQVDPSSDRTGEDIKAEMERISEEGGLLRREIKQFLEYYRLDVVRLQKEMAICRKSLEKAEFAEEASRLAIDQLERAGKELHSRCAAFLNHKAKTVFSRLYPECDSIEIKPDLSFSIRHRGLQTELDRNQVNGLLSVGARDQVYLALRLAVSQYLSASGIHLPFILDDALITIDDDRFLETMDFILKELTKTHQVIILTCHEKRHQWWLDQLSARDKGRIQISRLQPQSDTDQRASVEVT